MNKNKLPGFSTRAIHVGQEPDPESGAVSAPIHPTSTYVQQEIGKNKGYEYARVRIRRVRGWKRISLPSKAESLRASSPAAWPQSPRSAPCTNRATTWSAAIISTAACRVSSTRFSPATASSSLTWTLPTRNVERAIRKKTRMVYIETPTNPLMALTDFAAISKVCPRKKVEVVVDNTFMSPYFQQPIALGADMVVHSTTKFLNGHSDGLGGVVVCTRPSRPRNWLSYRKQRARFCRPSNAGWCCAALRRWPCAWSSTIGAAAIVAEFLARTQKGEKSFLSRIARPSAIRTGCRQMSGFGSMISVRNRLALQRQQDAAKGARLLAGRIAGRSRDSDLASRDHDPRAHWAKRKKRDWHHRWHGPDFRGDRERGRHNRRSGSGARRNVGAGVLAVRYRQHVESLPNSRVECQ